MAIIFLLGPSVWKAGKKTPAYSPMEMRRQIAEMFRENGHKVILMEDEPDITGEDLPNKFYRLLRDKAVTDVVVYWPSLAEMQTTHAEFVLWGACPNISQLPPIQLLHHASIFSVKGEVFNINDREDRNRYLTSILARQGVCLVEWESDEDLKEQVCLLSAEL